MPDRDDSVREIFGREPELEALRGLMSGVPRDGALLLTGDAGIGKTALWEAGLALSRAAGRLVMVARPTGAEAGMAFAGLIDLCDGVAPQLLAALPAPQRTALEVALLRADPCGDAQPDPHAIGVGFLNLLRAVSADVPVVIAVDDVPWLDAPSADALAFAARRLRDERVAFLMARRPGEPTALESALTPERHELAPLGLDAIRRLLAVRLGLFPTRVLLRRILEVSQGNALFALELGRSVRAAGAPRTSQEMILPDTVENALAARAAALAPGVQGVLLAVALSDGLRRAELDAIAGADNVDAGFDAGVVVGHAARVRTSHPLLAAAAVANSTPTQRRAAHRKIARAVADEELCALHLALATERPDPTLARRVAAAASRATARGARPHAVALAEHALRLTPENADQHGERLLALAAQLEMAGEERRMTDLLVPALARLPAGTPRARARLLLSNGAETTTFAAHQRQLDLALAEDNVDTAVRIQATATKVTATAVIAVERIPQALAWSQQALAEARDADADSQRRLLYSLAWATALSGRPIDDLCTRFRGVSTESVYLASSPERIAAQRLVWRGELAAARATLVWLLQRADEQGEGASYAIQRLHLCELELRVGAWDRAAGILDEWEHSAEGELLYMPMYERCRALVAAGRGEIDSVGHWSARAITRADADGDGWDRLEALRARGSAALLEQDPAAAAADLRAVHEHTEREGVREPGVFPVWPELVEALVELGELAEATAVTDILQQRAEEQDHPWALVTARRCRALVRLATGRFEDADGAALTSAAGELAKMGLAFDASRCRLSLGRAQRRAKQWSAARASLERTCAQFDELGSAGWASRARAELARVGGRTPDAPGALTVTEQHVVELAARGMSNKEIARRLSMAVHTVEVHLSRAYVKLGVRSRSQLAARRSQ